jgi:hypothetical protein
VSSAVTPFKIGHNNKRYLESTLPPSTILTNVLIEFAIVKRLNATATATATWQHGNMAIPSQYAQVRKEG